ncbi:MAG TPA: FecR domain-containing protein [Steroidobacteraceae bacterium]
MTAPASGSRKDIVGEAAAWFIEFRSGDATAQDRARFYEWLRRSPEHIQAYLEIAEGWSELPTSDPQGRLDIQALIRRARESQEENVIPLADRPAVQPRRPVMRLWAASLAGVAALILVAVLLMLRDADTYRTGVGEQRIVRLTDGSIVEMNALSKMRVRLSENAREIDLEQGQAMFRVAKDQSRPFLVHIGDTTVRAVGTQFDVYRKHTGTVVTVVEGTVAVRTGLLAAAPMPDREIVLSAGQQVRVPEESAAAQARLEPRRADVAAATAWVRKQLVFENTPLAEVIEEFNRYSARTLILDDPRLRSMAVSGIYSTSNPDALLGFLRAQPNIALAETDQEVRVALRDEK